MKGFLLILFLNLVLVSFIGSELIFMMMLNGSQWNQMRTTRCFNLKFLFENWYRCYSSFRFALFKLVIIYELPFHQRTTRRRLLSVELEAEILFTSYSTLKCYYSLWWLLQCNCINALCTQKLFCLSEAINCYDLIKINWKLIHEFETGFVSITSLSASHFRFQCILLLFRSCFAALRFRELPLMVSSLLFYFQELNTYARTTYYKWMLKMSHISCTRAKVSIKQPSVCFINIMNTSFK